MKIYVLVKQVPDTEARIKISGASIQEEGIKWIISPFDEHALEEALRLREKTDGKVTAVSVGPARATDSLRTAYALGVDAAIHIQDDAYNPFDLGHTASLLAAFLKAEEPDIILAGHIAIDSQSSMVPGMIAEHLGCANISNAIELNYAENRIKARIEIEGGTALMETSTPVVVTAAKSLNEPRYPSLKGIMASKKKKVEVRPADSFSVDVARVEMISLELPPARPEGRIIEGDAPEAKAADLVKLLREEAKVI